MTTNYEILSKSITPLIRKLSQRENLEVDDVEMAFDLLFEYDYEGYYWLALTLALRAKGETLDELYGICKSIQKLFDVSDHTYEAIDLSGSGGKPYKTINVGTASSFVVAAGGIKVAKQGSTAVTGLTGSMDIVANFGVDIKQKEDPVRLNKLLEKTNVVVYHSFLKSGRQNSRPDFLARLKRMGLTFVSPFHIVGGVPSGIILKYRLYGCSSLHYQEILANLFQRFGYLRGMIVTGSEGIDEISVLGSTHILEFTDKETKRYEVTPEDFGLSVRTQSEIETQNIEQNIVAFLRVLSGSDNGAKRDIVIANAAASFYIMGNVKSLYEGAQKAKWLLSEGLVWEKFKEFVAEAGDLKLLDMWTKKAEI